MTSFKDFIYFPSFSSAGIAPELKQNFKFSNGTPCRFYSKDMGDIRYPYFLISAGANFRNKDARKDFGLSDDVLVVGDSGGFQIKTGNLIKRLEDIFIEETRIRVKNILDRLGSNQLSNLFLCRAGVLKTIHR